jgi:type IX secretion system PorP/SprF family membrane protein
MKKLIFTTTLIVMLARGFAFAQQEPQLSQYMLNSYLYNPAVAGIDDYTDVKASYRKSYAGVPNAPNTFFITAHKAINQKELNKEDLGALPMRGASTIRFKTDQPKKIRHGLGAVFYNDKAAGFTHNFAALGYAIHLPVSRKFYFSVWAQAGFSLYGYDGNAQNVIFMGDKALQSGTATAVPEIKLGGLLYSDNLYVGLSTGQLAQNRLKFNTANTTLSKLNTHYYLTVGYRIPLTEEFDVIPNVLVKYSKPTAAGDLGVKVRYRGNFWAGAAFRAVNAKVDTDFDAVYGIVGFTLMDFVDLGYSFDFTTSKLSAGSSGSHEVLVGVRLFNKKKASPKLW